MRRLLLMLPLLAAGCTDAPDAPGPGELAYGDGRLLIGSSNGAVTAIRLDSTALLTDGFE